MTNYHVTQLMLPVAVLYGIMILRFLAFYILRVFGDKEDEKESMPFRRSLSPPASEFVLAGIVLDLADIVGKWSDIRESFSSGVPHISLLLPVLLIVFHCQLYILSILIQQRMNSANRGSSRRVHMLFISLLFGFLAIFTNALTVSAMLNWGGF